MIALSLLAGLAVTTPSLAQPTSRVWPQGLIEVQVASGWQEPVGLCFADDGRMFVWEKGGRVWNVENGVKAAQPLINLSEEVGNWRDFGMLGFALDPYFYDNGYIYLLYVVDYHHLKYFGTPQYNSGTNEYFHDTIGRLVRYTANAADGFRSVDYGSRVVLIGESITTGIPILHQSHGTGSLAFGEDGTLLVSCGDGASYSVVDKGGAIGGSSNTGLADGIIKTKEDVGAYRSQLVDSHSGKVLRIDPATGDGVPSNPFWDASAPRAPRSRVWAMGLRNPFRMFLLPESGSHNPADAQPGTLYIGDVGWNEREELNVCDAPAQNFGWPVYEGMDLQPGYLGQSPANKDAPNPLFGVGGCNKQYFTFENLIVQDTLAAPSWPNPCNTSVQIPSSIPRFEHVRPLIDWRHGSSTGGPSRTKTYSGQSATSINLNAPGSPIPGPNFGGNCAVACTFIPNDAYGPLFHDSIVFGDYANDFLYTLAIDHGGAPQEVNTLSAPGETGGLVAAAFDRFTDQLYFIEFDNTGGTGVKRLVDTSNKPPIVVATATPNFGPAPLSVQLQGSDSSDPEGLPLTYLWDFGDGSTSTQADPVHLFTKGGAPAGPLLRNVSLTVTDPGGNDATAVIPVSLDNTPPQVSIISPVNGSYFSMTQNTQVPLTAFISDDEYAPEQLACSWLVVLHHDEHTHPEPPDPSCSSSAIVSPVGCDGHSYFYEFTLTVTDPAGLAASQSVYMFPGCCGATDPQSASVCAGAPVSFSTTPTSSGSFTYQWEKDGNPIPGASAPTYSIAAVSAGDAGSYTAVVTGSCGTVETNPAILTVNSSVTASAPASATVCTGSPASFSTSAGGTGPYTYQWRKNGNAIGGATSSSYTIASVASGDAGSYSVTVTGACGNVTTPAATLTVNTSVTASTPSAVTACSGSPASFSTTAGGTGPHSYQWRKNGNAIGGATTSSYTIPSVATGDAGSYSVSVTGACGTVTTPGATLTVNTAVTASTPSNATVCAGSPASFSTTAGGTGPHTYQWHKNGNAVPGATASSYSIASVAAGDAGSYSVSVTGACGTITTSAATLTVNSAVTASTPSGATVCAGAAASFSTTAGGTGPFTYQWRKDGNAIPGATASSYSIASVAAGDAGSYSVAVTGACGTITTPGAALVVNSAVTASAPSNAIVCSGSPASFSTTAGGTGPHTYQWRKNGSPIPGATASSYSIAAAVPGDAGDYSVSVTGACGSVTTPAATLTVNTAVTASTPANVTVCAGAAASFSTTPGGSGPFAFQWRKNGNAIPGATAASYAIASTVLGDAGAYSVSVTGACGTVTTPAATLAVNSSVTATPPSNAIACAGSPASFSTTAGGTGPFTYQWHKDGNAIPGATASSYAIAAVAPGDQGAYSVAVAGACGSLMTPTAMLTVNSSTTASAPSSVTACVGSPASFSTTAGGTGPFTYQWRKDGNAIPGATGATYAIAAVSGGDAGQYTVEVGGACGAVQSAPAQLVVSGVTSVYCTAQANSQGCLPVIGSSGTPSASAGSGYFVAATKVLPQATGLFIYSTTGPAATPFQGGFICGAGVLRRATTPPSSGSGRCGGVLRIDFNAYIASGLDPALVAGAQYWGQFWSRDPLSASGTNLTDAATAVICP
jgi:glucose/arabinose dehydrogenase